MALLGATSLTGCNSIPQFLPGNADVGVTTSAASRTVFRMATSPVSWTKDTTAFDGTLRIVNSSTLSPGGSLNFPTVFSSSVPLSVTFDANPINLTVNPTIALPTTFATSPGGNTSTQPVTLSLAQVATHSHSYNTAATGLIGPGATANIADQVANTPNPTTGVGGDGAHLHTIPAHLHQISNHPGSLNLHNHSVTSTSHTHTVTSTQNFNINYVDIIISRKD